MNLRYQDYMNKTKSTIYNYKNQNTKPLPCCQGKGQQITADVEDSTDNNHNRFKCEFNFINKDILEEDNVIFRLIKKFGQRFVARNTNYIINFRNADI